MTKYFAALLMFIAAWPSFAADRNGYTAQYECRAGGPNCNVDVATYVAHTCDQTITSADSAATISSKINDAGSQYICVSPGDYTGKGTITLKTSGTSGAFRVLRYYRSGDTNDDPWNQSPQNQAQFRYMNLSGSYWIVHRLTFPTYVASGTSRVHVGGSHVIFNRLLIEGGGDTEACYAAISNANETNSDITVQNGVIRGLRHCTGGSPVAVDLESGNNHKVVNNELYDWCEHPIQLGQNNIPTMTNLAVENNDIYVSPASITASGDAAMGWGVSVKALGTAASPNRITHNRFWNKRKQDGSVCGTPDSSAAIGFNAATSANSGYMLIQNNIVTDSVQALGFYNNTIQNVSVIGNLFYNIAPMGSQTASNAIALQDAYSTELYLNTLINAHKGTASYVVGGWRSNIDLRCDVLIDVDNFAATPGDSSVVVNNNVFYNSASTTYNGSPAANINAVIRIRANSATYSTNAIMRTGAITGCSRGTESACFLYKAIVAGTSADSPPAPCTTLGCTYTDGGVTWKAIRGPYTFYRKLNTSPEQYTIPYARPYVNISNTSDGVQEANTCPSSYATRSGIGINDAN